MDDILTLQEVAAYLKVSRTTVWRWCNEGTLSAFKAGKGWRVHRFDLERFLGYRISKINGGEAGGDHAKNGF